MLVARTKGGKEVLAWRAEEPCFCLECGEGLFVKDGAINVTHFSHYPEAGCGYGTGESARHLLLKSRVLDACSKWPDARLEKVVVEGRRADVVIPKIRVVVECQSSAIKEEEWTRRTLDYSDQGWHVLWVWDRRRCDLDA